MNANAACERTGMLREICRAVGIAAPGCKCLLSKTAIPHRQSLSFHLALL